MLNQKLKTLQNFLQDASDSAFEFTKLNSKFAAMPTTYGTHFQNVLSARSTELSVLLHDIAITQAKKMIDEPDDWFVNSKTGALVFIKGVDTLSLDTINNAFGCTMANVIFSNENQIGNWNRLGDDTMFDTNSDIISKTLSFDYKSSYHAEEFANTHGLKKTVIYLIEVKTAEVFNTFGQEERIRETIEYSNKILASDISYSKPSKIGEITPIKVTKTGNRMELEYTTKVFTKVMDYNSQNKNDNDGAIEKTISITLIIKEILDAFKK